MPRNVVESQSGPKAIGPYSHAVWAGDLLFLSGQIPIDPATSNLVPGDVAAQTEKAIDNVEAILKDAGLSLDDVVKNTVFLTSMANFQAMNAVYQRRFRAPCPARSAIGVQELPKGALVEIEAIAKKS